MISAADDHLMMIEPKGPATKPIVDWLTALAWAVLHCGHVGNVYRGFHQCVCARCSDNCDHIVGPYKTNSLLPHYVACHREEIPEGELIKLVKAAEALGIKWHIEGPQI